MIMIAALIGIKVLLDKVVNQSTQLNWDFKLIELKAL